MSADFADTAASMWSPLSPAPHGASIHRTAPTFYSPPLATKSGLPKLSMYGARVPPFASPYDTLRRVSSLNLGHRMRASGGFFMCRPYSAASAIGGASAPSLSACSVKASITARSIRTVAAAPAPGWSSRRSR